MLVVNQDGCIGIVMQEHESTPTSVGCETWNSYRLSPLVSLAFRIVFKFCDLRHVLFTGILSDREDWERISQGKHDIGSSNCMCLQWWIEDLRGMPNFCIYESNLIIRLFCNPS
ncbi:hypothetical protein L6164_032578 [Bauhinia variegata]|uniref:Uncharacterized protein n=1 Tax=Bauhinia variegata TaxID=167791 RepID=A0ACB9KP60_BAUVA|nr:hypothetical protein L6164_032578 [Bauhinia variegata]